jgi:hypothetical protein
MRFWRRTGEHGDPLDEALKPSDFHNHFVIAGQEVVGVIDEPP